MKILGIIWTTAFSLTIIWGLLNIIAHNRREAKAKRDLMAEIDRLLEWDENSYV